MAYQRTPYVESKRAEARARLVQAALALMARGGWRQVQVSDVALEAGLSTGTVYLHFGSKTELLTEVYRSQASAELQVVTQIADQAAPAARRIALAVQAFAKRAMSNRRLAYAMVLEPTEIAVEEERLRFHACFIEQFRRILDAGVASGEFDVADTHIAAACIFGGITESLMSPLGIASRSPERGSGRNDAAVLVDRIVAFCFDGLGRPASTGRRRAGARSATRKSA